MQRRPWASAFRPCGTSGKGIISIELCVGLRLPRTRIRKPSNDVLLRGLDSDVLIRWTRRKTGALCSRRNAFKLRNCKPPSVGASLLQDSKWVLIWKSRIMVSKMLPLALATLVIVVVLLGPVFIEAIE